MLSADYGNHIRYASAAEFTVLRKRVLTGQTLDDVRILQTSLKRFGLLTPLTVIERSGKLVVVDGRKRLAAIQRLSFLGELPRSLIHIPYELISETSVSPSELPSLTASQTLFGAVERAFRRGANVATIAQRLQISSQSVRDLLILSRLSKSLRRSFFDKLISFSQAAAYATIPDHAEQTHLFQALGPFAKPEEICSEAAMRRKTHSVSLAA